MQWQEHLDFLNDILRRLSVTGENGCECAPDDAFAALFQRTVRLRQESRTIYCVGNGASASIASHFAADMAKNGALHTEVFTDLALLSAISNDMGFEFVYAEPLRRRAKAGDLLVAISSSGSSPNILKCVDCARTLGIDVVTLSAMRADNPLRRSGFLNFYVPAGEYGDAESLHAMLLHYWIDLFLKK